MLYYTVVLERRPDVDQASFERLWLGDHLAMARDLPGIAGAAFHPRATSVDPDDPVGGVGYLCFPDDAALAAALRTPAALAMREHTATFAATDRTRRLVARDPTGFGVAVP